jgi:hypothetical protein
MPDATKLMMMLSPNSAWMVITASAHCPHRRGIDAVKSIGSFADLFESGAKAGRCD